jgi:MATE family multidrug resistance protein
MLFSASIDVRALLASHYHWLFLLTLGAAPSYLFDGIFVGATRTREMCYTMLGCVLLVYLPVWYLTQGWANHGLWFSFLLFNIGRGLSLGWIYRSRQAVSDWLDV